ncbi:hypothetical protein [Echinococcus multilocularis]|uniref:Uncharacterized protein n=1 Tax=Echinococcus multilocularis TaxID=6211 RepID=A0A068Y281_ECHMU|nr:hypothetical protein [Echinococcus multilocularis]
MAGPDTSPLSKGCKTSESPDHKNDPSAIFRPVELFRTPPPSPPGWARPPTHQSARAQLCNKIDNPEWIGPHVLPL